MCHLDVETGGTLGFHHVLYTKDRGYRWCEPPVGLNSVDDGQYGLEGCRTVSLASVRVLVVESSK
jgi:hypothetical protein